LVYREAWRANAAGALCLLPDAFGPLLVELPDSLQARDPASGAQLWSVAAMPGAVARGGDLFYCEKGDALVRLDMQSGEPRWKRRLRGALHPSRLWAIEGGVLRALPEEGLALVKDGGALGFRARLPGGAPVAAALVEGVVVAALASGSIAGLDAGEGRVLWKLRHRASAIVPFESRALLVGEGWLACLESGKMVWERELPWLRELAVSEEIIVATGAGGAAARLDEKGAVLWSLPAEGDAPAAPALLQREVVLLRRAQICLHDAAEGLPIAQLPPARGAALAPDLSCALLQGDEIVLYRLATHLSVLTT
jgi:outer membrane protein assembly factor BamB